MKKWIWIFILILLGIAINYFIIVNYEDVEIKETQKGE